MADSQKPFAGVGGEGLIKVGNAEAPVVDLVFTVLAGKYESPPEDEDPIEPHPGLNIKYISDDFNDLTEAQADLAKVSDYPWAIIEVKGKIYP